MVNIRGIQMADISVMERLPSLQEYVDSGGTEDEYFSIFDEHRRVMARILEVSPEELHAMGPDVAKERLESKVQSEGEG